MELLAREQLAEQHVRYYLKATDEPIDNLLPAFTEYREACQEVIFDDFETRALPKGTLLWHLHTEGKKYLHKALSGLRKQPGQHDVYIRKLTKVYLQFIKDTQRFYRQYIHRLNSTFGGIQELEAVAHQVKSDPASGSSQTSLSPAFRQKLLESCHQSLICLGDLSRYRASEKLDKAPDFGPAIGYYELACTLIPSSGMGHHQLAIVPPAQTQHLCTQHLRTIYHLYRAMVVDDPHPNAPNNLKLEFDKTNAAWDRGELIPKGSPADPESSKRTLTGWFVRLHSMCFDGEPFKGFHELESEVLSQLTAEIKLRSLGSSLRRMTMVNLAAQYNAGEKFQQNPTQQNQNAFLQFFRNNIKMFSTFLRVFHEELSGVEIAGGGDDGEVDLATRISDTARHILPAIRLYSSWLLSMVHLLAGLSTEESLKEAIAKFWRQYARTIDLVAAVFPIWDLDDLREINYLLEEDTDTIGFKPLTHERTKKVWYHKQTGTLKSRFSDHGIARATEDEEMLARVKQFLVDGLFLANDDDDAPIKLRGTRILHRDAEDVEVLPMIIPKESEVVKAPAKPLSYAAAAANGAAQAQRHATKPDGVLEKSNSLAQHVQLSRMVDDLVDDDEVNHPITPPQKHASHPTVVTNGDVTYSARSGGGHQGFAQLPNYSHHPKPRQPPVDTSATAPSPSLRTPKSATPIDRLPSLSSLWNDTASGEPISSFPSGLPTGTLASPAQLHSRVHSRVNSASSIRSRTPQNMPAGLADSRSTLDGGFKATTTPLASSASFGNSLGGFDHSLGASPLLFGAGGGRWSARNVHGGRNMTPPSGQEGG